MLCNTSILLLNINWGKNLWQKIPTGYVLILGTQESYNKECQPKWFSQFTTYMCITRLEKKWENTRPHFSHQRNKSFIQQYNTSNIKHICSINLC